MSAASDQTEEFLGRGFVPLVLAGVAVGVVAFVALDRIGHAYLFASGSIALALTVRFSWEKRSVRHYRLIVAILAACQILAVCLLGSHASRAPGAAYMALALIEALVMTLLVNGILKFNSAPR